MAHNGHRDKCPGPSPAAHAEQGLGGPTPGQVSRGELINTPNLTTAFPFFLPHLLSARANLLNGAGVYLGAFSRRRHSLHFLKAVSGALRNKFAPHPAQKTPPCPPPPPLSCSLCLKVCEQGGKIWAEKSKIESPRGLSRAL